jgi:hypothetical protein
MAVDRKKQTANRANSRSYQRKSALVRGTWFAVKGSRLDFPMTAIPCDDGDRAR